MKKSMRNHKFTERPAPAPPPPPQESEFSFTLARVAVAQICQSLGFNGAQRPALEALTDIATRYLKTIAKLSAAAANSGCRTESNIFDIVVALEGLETAQGFPGCSSVRSRSVSTSAVVKDLMKFVKYTDEIPFAQPLPPWRNSFQSGRGSLLRCRDNSRWYNVGGLKHVPRWLPAVPLVEEDEKREERVGEAKWGCLCGKEKMVEENWEGGDRRKTAKRETSNEMGIPEKRGEVKFKMGDHEMIGKLRGVGVGIRNGKRVGMV